jgi:hypothetical protein
MAGYLSIFPVNIRPGLNSGCSGVELGVKLNNAGLGGVGKVNTGPD